jgi:hypothetical protein
MEMEAWGAAELRRIPCGAALRVNKKSLTILQNKCVQLVRELDRKEETLRQVGVCVNLCVRRPDRTACPRPPLVPSPHDARPPPAAPCSSPTQWAAWRAPRTWLPSSWPTSVTSSSLSSRPSRCRRRRPRRHSLWVSLPLPTRHSPNLPPAFGPTSKVSVCRDPAAAAANPLAAPRVGTVVGPASPLTQCVRPCNAARELQEERAKSAALQEQLRQAQV